MKLNKIKTSLSLASLRKLKQDFGLFTIETKSSNKKSENVAVSKTLTKVLAKNTNLSKYLDSNLLKYPLTINFFTNLENLLSHLKNNLDKKENNIIFINTDKVVSKENNIKQLSCISPPDLFRNLNSFFSPTILVLKCLQISAANNTTKS
jgi:ribosomal protein L16 Arg81 hydroxylase